MAFTSLKETLQKVLKAHGFVEDVDSYKIFYLWDKIVGPITAAHARPARIDKKTLFVEVDDPIWLTQLRYMKLMIIKKMEREIKRDALKDVRFFLKQAPQAKRT